MPSHGRSSSSPPPWPCSGWLEALEILHALVTRPDDSDQVSWACSARARTAKARSVTTLAVLLFGGAGLLASCAPPASTAPPRTKPSKAGGQQHLRRTPATSTTTTTTVPAQPGWTVLATESTGVAVDARTVTEPDGSSVRVIRFRAGQVRFDLHVGSVDPPAGSVSFPPEALPKIAPTEAAQLLGAFNGGFKVTAHAGGFEVDGHVLTPLEDGMASLVIGTSGLASIQVWGGKAAQAVAGQPVSVRQNLPPLVRAGSPAASAPTWTAWGETLGGGPYVARSALGEDASGDLLYAASMSTVPIDLADALVSSGAVIGMELDINPEWVQADVAPSPGGGLIAEVPGQNRPADQYQVGWTRDFVAVLARG